MRRALGWYCAAIGLWQMFFLLTTWNVSLDDPNYRLRRDLFWLTQPMFLGVTAVAWRN
jgi:hypothetical protein